MSPIYDVANSPLTLATLGYLKDLGYTVDHTKAQDIGVPIYLTTEHKDEDDQPLVGVNEFGSRYFLPDKSVLIGYTGTELLKYKWYNPDNKPTSEGFFDETMRQATPLNTYLSQRYDSVFDRLTNPNLRKCNCKKHATKNPILPN